MFRGTNNIPRDIPGYFHIYNSKLRKGYAMQYTLVNPIENDLGFVVFG